MIVMLQVCNYPGSQFRVQGSRFKIQGSRLERKRGLGVFNVSDGQFHTLKEIIVAICQAVGRNPPRYFFPIGPARFMAGLMEDTFRLVGRKSPIGCDTIDKYTEDIAVDSQLIQRELGFKLQFDLLTGWRETLQEMRKTGEL